MEIMKNIRNEVFYLSAILAIAGINNKCTNDQIQKQQEEEFRIALSHINDFSKRNKNKSVDNAICIVDTAPFQQNATNDQYTLEIIRKNQWREVMAVLSCKKSVSKWPRDNCTLAYHFKWPKKDLKNNLKTNAIVKDEWLTWNPTYYEDDKLFSYSVNHWNNWYYNNDIQDHFFLWSSIIKKWCKQEGIL